MNRLKILILSLISTISIVTHAQSFENNFYATNAQSKSFQQENRYTTTGLNYKQSKEWQKYKTLRAIGWSSLGVGIPTTLCGVILSAFQNSLSGSGGAGVPLIVAGGTLTLASIPLLTCAYHYRKKAINLNFSVSSIETNISPNFAFDHSPALCFSVNF